MTTGDCGQKWAHEEAFVRAFIHKDRQKRHLALLEAKKRGRYEFLELLRGTGDIDTRRAVRLKAPGQGAKALKKLARLQAPELCYVFSPDLEEDGQVVPLTEAVEAIVVRGGVASCILGRLYFYADEDGSDAMILSK